MGKYID